MKKIIPEKIKRQFRILRSIIGTIIYGFPSDKLKIIGVTGTSGKSTTANLIYHILEKNGFNVGVISTVGAKAGKKSIETGLHVTTPDPMQLQQLLRFMVKRKIEYVVLECSSHALDQGRLGLTKFDYAVYTNIKRDHLDWHKTWERYAAAKAILAEKTKPTGKIIVNREDKDMYNFLSNHLGSKNFADKSITYSIKEPVNIQETPIGIRFALGNQDYQLPMLGKYNVENALAAINLCQDLGLSTEQIASAMKEFLGVEGRMQIMKVSPVTVIVDFAHNADSLVNSLKTVNNLKTYGNRVITVFGSAGLRDIEKRYTMGQAAAENANIVVITAEDPRTESLEKINSQIVEGTQMGGSRHIRRFKNTKEYEFFSKRVKDPKLDIMDKSVFVFDEENINSRYDAIEFAIRIATPGDIVITEGKGHEKSLCFDTVEYPFTDQEAVERAFRNLQLK